jgi:hypothetical protein
MTLNPPGRLLVLVPNQSLDEKTFALQIANLTQERNIPVFLFDILDTPDQEPFASIRLDNLTNLLASISTSAESRIISTADWLVEFLTTCHDNDLVVCLEEHTLQVINGDYIPAWEILPAVQNQPLLVLSGFYTETRFHQPSHQTRLVWWIITSAILIIFSVIQFSLIQTTQDWEKPFLIFISFLIEISVLHLWNKFGFRHINQ